MPTGSVTSSATRTSLRRPAAWERFAAALDDDFNTPAALAVMHEWRDHDLLRRALGDLRARVARRDEDAAPAEVVALAEQRSAARATRDFDEADRLRSEIEAAGWEVRDEADALPPRPPPMTLTRDAGLRPERRPRALSRPDGACSRPG